LLLLLCCVVVEFGLRGENVADGIDCLMTSSRYILSAVSPNEDASPHLQWVNKKPKHASQFGVNQNFYMFWLILSSVMSSYVGMTEVPSDRTPSTASCILDTRQLSLRFTTPNRFGHFFYFVGSEILRPAGLIPG
jgi:hypothetical protein